MNDLIDTEKMLIEYKYHDLLSVDGKSERGTDNKNIIVQDVYAHVQDVYNEFKILIDLNRIDKDSDFANLVFLSIMFHDFGKANDDMQRRIKDSSIKFGENEIGHNFLSLFLMDNNLPFLKNSKKLSIIRYAILNHHHHCDNNFQTLYATDFNEVKRVMGKFNHYCNDLSVRDKNNIFKLRTEVMADESIDYKLPNRIAVLVTGALQRCDRLASAGICIDYKNDFLLNKLDGLLNHWKEKNPNADWTDMQKFMKQNTDKNIIVVAPTGSGKTEGGLLWGGDNKIIYILSMRTAIKAMFFRIVDMFGKESVVNKIGLLDGDSKIEYKNLFTDTKTKDYYKNESILDYYNSTRQWCNPVTVSTPDQILNMVFQYCGYEQKASVLSQSKIILDEIQSYEPQLLSFIIYSIKMINEWGGKICVITATLPPFLRDKLFKITNDYEKTPIDFVEKNFCNVPTKDRHKIRLINSKISSSMIYEHIKELKAHNIKKKILIICNTIKKAQEIYKELKMFDSTLNVNMLHSKFIKKDRGVKETNILADGETFQKDEVTLNEKDSIWISTSIVEASLDIDFDELHTEICDLSSLFQRFGRINRKAKKSILFVNCYIYMQIDFKYITTQQNPNKGFIDGGILHLSKQALIDFCKNQDTIISEIDKNNLIDTYLTTNNLNKADSVFNIVYNKQIGELKKISVYEYNKEVCFRNITSYQVIPQPIYDTNKTDIDDLYNQYLLYTNQMYHEKDKEIKLQIAQKLITTNEKFMMYTVPVGHLDVFFTMNDFDESNSYITKTFLFGKTRKLFVVKCNYNFDFGFERISMQERIKMQKKNLVDDDSDIFI